MTTSSFQPAIAAFAKLLILPLFVLALSGCGGGGGDATDPSNHPAPQTMNGLVFELWAGGPKFTFVRSAGNANNGGTETGGFVYNLGATASASPDEEGATAADEIDSPVYSYQKTDSDLGILTIQGSATGGTYPVGVFERRYRITFGAVGGIVGDLVTFDYDDGATGGTTGDPAIWRTGGFSHYDRGALTVGYNQDESNLRDLPYLYPSDIAVLRERLELTPTAPATDDPAYEFLVSAFLDPVLSDPVVINNETGTGTRELGTAVTNISFDYNPNTTTINEVTLTIVPSGESAIVYNLTFTSKNGGDYVIQGSGDAGTFFFPRIDNTGS